ncbi:glycerol-3-phosphate acyltransferase 3 [Indicator indicator]|uniref:glycerol-3-phosphate acyltransferase 3 n=1 Tax=Indicator indicator TaxID=1002788 RepID=UPI0023DFEB1E|nr:glycerol-3-phosphate acyltransferase 3 [Indicator indicator]
MEEWGWATVRLGAVWLALVFALVVLPSALDISLGISEAYMRLLVRTLEWATISAEKGGPKPRPEKPKSPAANGIIQRVETPMEKEIARLRQADFEFSDIFYFCRKGFEAIVEDEVTQRFSSEELVSWNLLTRTNVNFHYVNVRLSLLWGLGVLVRYCLLLPLRFTLASIGIMSVIVGTTVLGQLPNSRVKSYLSELIHLTCCRILVRALSGTIHFHNKENRPQKGGICVANHTSPIDAIILTSDNCYAMVGQVHGGLLGVMQRAAVKGYAHVWFERSEMKDRHLVAKRLRDHVADKSKLPILIFPEGTCINNTSVMMFKKGSFEIGGTIYPVAMKYDPQFGDAFWNSSKHSMVSYLLRIMTSWAIVCNVWYMPPMVREEGEDAVQFANRVRSAIAHQGGLTELPWDGGLKRAKVKDTFKEEQQKNYSKMLVRNGSVGGPSAEAESD